MIDWLIDYWYFTQLNKNKILKQPINGKSIIYIPTSKYKKHLTNSFVIISVNRKLIFHEDSEAVGMDQPSNLLFYYSLFTECII